MQSRRIVLLIAFALSVGLLLFIATASANRLPKPSHAPGEQNNPASDTADLRELAQQMPHERRLSGGESHSYRVKIVSGQHLYLLVNERGVDVLLKVFAPDDRLLAEVNDQNNMQEVELLALIAESSGFYRLEVHPTNNAASGGRYEISMEVLEPSTPEGRKRIAAERAYADAERLRQKGNADSDRKANEKYHEALLLWREVGDRLREAKTLYSIGRLFLRLNDTQASLENFQQALLLYRAVGYQRGEASAVPRGGDRFRVFRPDEKGACVVRAIASTIHRSR